VCVCVCVCVWLLLDTSQHSPRLYLSICSLGLATCTNALTLTCLNIYMCVFVIITINRSIIVPIIYIIINQFTHAPFFFSLLLWLRHHCLSFSFFLLSFTLYFAYVYLMSCQRAKRRTLHQQRRPRHSHLRLAWKELMKYQNCFLDI